MGTRWQHCLLPPLAGPPPPPSLVLLMLMLLMMMKLVNPFEKCRALD